MIAKGNHVSGAPAPLATKPPTKRHKCMRSMHLHAAHSSGAPAPTCQRPKASWQASDKWGRGPTCNQAPNNPLGCSKWGPCHTCMPSRAWHTSACFYPSLHAKHALISKPSVGKANTYKIGLRVF